MLEAMRFRNPGVSLTLPTASRRVQSRSQVSRLRSAYDHLRCSSGLRPSALRPLPRRERVIVAMGDGVGRGWSGALSRAAKGHAAPSQSPGKGWRLCCPLTLTLSPGGRGEVCGGAGRGRAVTAPSASPWRSARLPAGCRASSVSGTGPSNPPSPPCRRWPRSSRGRG